MLTVASYGRLALLSLSHENDCHNMRRSRSDLCSQVPYLAVKKSNRSILTESNIFCKYIIPIISEKRIRLAFADDYCYEKWDGKVMFLCIIRCNKKIFFK